MKRRPKFSILIPTYNREEFLKTALDSALAQTFKDYEIIVSDNCSSDGTRALLKRYAAKDKRIRYHIQKKNLGSVGNIKFLLKETRGEYSLYLFDDDLIDKGMLHSFSRLFDEHPEISFIYTTKRWVDKDLNTIKKTTLPRKEIYVEKYGLMRTEEIFGMTSGVFKTGNVQLDDHSSAIDQVLSIELTCKGAGILYDGGFYRYRFHPGNESQDPDLFDKSVGVFDTFRRTCKSLPKEIRHDFEVYTLDQKYLLFMTSILYNGLRERNLKKTRLRLRLLRKKTDFFRIRPKGLFIFIKNSLTLIGTAYKYRKNR